MQSEVNSMYSRFSIAISSRSGRAGSREISGLPTPCFLHDLAFAANRIVDRVQKHHRVDGLQWSL